MWTFNVVRELARRAGRTVLPEQVFTEDAAWIDFANREAGRLGDPTVMFVLKTHRLLQGLHPDSLVITNIRDIRDSVMSFMRFMRTDFESALHAARSQAATADYYVDWPEDRRMVIRYDEITGRASGLVARIADRLGLESRRASAPEIAAKFSREAVRAMTEERDRRQRETGSSPDAAPGEFLVARPDGRLSTIDLATGFQSDHVSGYEDGDWRRLLSDQQIDRLQQTFGPWLAKHGYAD